MPITEIQKEILLVIASKRNPDSFVAGGLPINRSGPRFSADIDIFHEREERVAAAAQDDAAALAAAGYSVVWVRQQPAVYAAIVGRPGFETKLEWVADSDYRFFPVVADPQFGFVLNIVDLGTNKVMAAASRREPRDVVDLLTLHKQVLPLGALAWAATEIAPGYTPEGIIGEIRRNARHAPDEFAQLAAERPIDPALVMAALRNALAAAEAFVAAMPTKLAGRIFLEKGRPVQPDPVTLDRYVVHAAARRGHWPTSSDISSAMLQQLQATVASGPKA